MKKHRHVMLCFYENMSKLIYIRIIGLDNIDQLYPRLYYKFLSLSENVIYGGKCMGCMRQLG